LRTGAVRFKATKLRLKKEITMIRLTLTALAALLIAPTAFAADDGGFGSQRFSNQAPLALSDEPGSSAFANTNTNPAEIEPAAGVEDDDQASADGRDAEAIADDPYADERPPAK
jgi:uncharacterized protein YdeI (BOF family)